MVDSAPDRGDSAGQIGAAGSLLRSPTVELPKGGGAIRGIGEKFAANPVTGTGSMTIPFAVSPGRSGFGPALSLSYDSGAGNGPFGFGWHLGLPSITRKTDVGIPTYDDAGESDVYILSGSEDLVPVLIESPATGRWERQAETRVVADSTYVVQRYRPRVEGLFARIERWTDAATREIHWRSISRDNITTMYGLTGESRIADPQHPDRVFSWLICQSFDDSGNAMVYGFAGEDDAGVDVAQTNESNRTSLIRSSNRYLKTIRYGNRSPNRDLADWVATDPSGLDDWMFEVVFDYGEGHVADLPLDPNLSASAQHTFSTASLSPLSEWPVRLDPFSSYRSAFEVRTYRLCQRVLVFHHFPDELGVADCLVRSTDLTYTEGPVATLLTAATQTGYVHRPDANGANRYLRRSMPPVEFTYNEPPTAAEIAAQPIQDVDAATEENLPDGLDGVNYQWVDFDGAGVGGVLTEQGGEWFFKRNLSPAHHPDGPAQPAHARLGALEPIGTHPSLTLASGGRFVDLAGDGRLDLVDMRTGAAGFYERSISPDIDGWEQFRPFDQWPTIDLDHQSVRLLDVTGDGHADALIADDDVFTWYRSLAEDGYEFGGRVSHTVDEESGPRVVFADPLESIHDADLSGDGLTDIVRLRNGEVCYWPNLGYGRFGARVTMDNSPVFDTPDQFDARRIQFVDVNGGGPADIVYAGRDGVRLHLNQSGNAWGTPTLLPQVPSVDSVASLQTLGLLGNGTACLVWSSPSTGNVGGRLRYVDLMGGAKPFLLRRVENNLGAETLIQYAPSTKFYVQDREAGRPWITRLPFPVHVVERIETRDHIGRTRYVSRFAYHHGAFDGVEREFRGFGMVEQWDSEEFETFQATGDSLAWKNVDAASHVPPTHTKTWFHTGLYFGRGHVSDFFAGLVDDTDDGEYYREPSLGDAAAALLLPDTVMPEGLTADEEREACRCLRGSMLRQETYGLDGSIKEPHPYTVAEQNFTIRVVQPKGAARHAAFFPHPRETITSHYERNPADPRTLHALTLEVDDFGNVLREAAVGYGRRDPDTSLPHDTDRNRQQRTLITYTEGAVTNAVATPDSYRAPLPAETRTYELTGTPPENGSRYGFAEWSRDAFDLTVSAAEIPYEDDADGQTRQRRLIEHTRSLYRSDDFSRLLTLGSLESQALDGESYQLAFTPGLLEQVFRRNGQQLLPVPADVLAGGGQDRGGYLSSDELKARGAFPAIDLDGHWWMPSGRAFLSPEPSHSAAEEQAHARRHFYLAHRFRNPFHTPEFNTESTIAYDVHDLMIVETEDAVGNRTTVGQRLPSGATDPTAQGNDYRALQPVLMSDANRNRTHVALDALGIVVATAVMGKPEEAEGDSLAGVEPDLTEDEIAQHLSQPQTAQNVLLGSATTRSIYDIRAFLRSKLATNPAPGVAHTMERETHVSDLAPSELTEVQHAFSFSDGFGRVIQQKTQAEPGPLTPGGSAVNPRWVGSGWTIFNNKGDPVQQFEPFFTDTERFEHGRAEGVSAVLFYDAAGRVTATLHPNHTYEKVLFDPWQATTWDVNDTVLLDPRTDPDIQGATAAYFDNLGANSPGPSWETWHAQRQAGALGVQDQAAAVKAGAHAGTPTTSHGDSLGRPFLTVAQNRVTSANHDLDGTEDTFHTRLKHDIEGNERAVRDAIQEFPDTQGNVLVDGLGRVVMRYAYDMLGNRIHQSSMEAGERWILNDVAGNPIRAWDSLEHSFRSAYDPLRRPVRSFVTGVVQGDPSRELLTDRWLYGEQHPQAALRNLRGTVYLQLEQAGAVSVEKQDFKGNPLRSTRRLATEYKQALDWTLVEAALPDQATSSVDLVGLEVALLPLLEPDTYTSSSSFDALNRPVAVTTPHTASMQPNTIRPGYNKANLLKRIDANLSGASANGQKTWTPFATNVEYDAKGQRQRIDYGNGASTIYQYDPLTFRLVHLLTRRDPGAFPDDCPQPSPTGCQLQNLHYTYDPAGNITHIRDDAQQTIYFSGERVEPSSEYTYDALYRLIRATGREHLGQGKPPMPHSHHDTSRTGLKSGSLPGQFGPNDSSAMGNYVERYVYDGVGNFIAMQHRGSNPSHAGWTRNYRYAEPSQLEPGKPSNRLTSTTLSGTKALTEKYSTDVDGYDAHGSMQHLPHLSLMRWDHRDQLRATARQVVNNGGPVEMTWYVYDSGGERVRKLTELANGSVKQERIYLGGFEVYREYQADGSVKLERESLHVMDDQQRVALVETRTIGVEAGFDAQLTRYQLGNHLTSASLELDEGAKIISYEEYTPYGSTAYQAGRSQAEVRRKQYRYTGVEPDKESGLSYHSARYYLPWLGCWGSTDPAGLNGGINLYRYASNSPASAVDLEGLKPTSVSGESTFIARLRSFARNTTVVVAQIAGSFIDRNPETIRIDPPALPTGQEKERIKRKETPYEAEKNKLETEKRVQKRGSPTRGEFSPQEIAAREKLMKFETDLLRLYPGKTKPRRTVRPLGASPQPNRVSGQSGSINLGVANFLAWGALAAERLAAGEPTEAAAIAAGSAATYKAVKMMPKGGGYAALATFAVALAVSCISPGGTCNPVTLGKETGKALYAEARDNPVRFGFDLGGFGTFSIGQLIDRLLDASGDSSDRGAGDEKAWKDEGFPDWFSHAAGFGAATPVLGIGVRNWGLVARGGVRSAKYLGGKASDLWNHVWN